MKIRFLRMAALILVVAALIIVPLAGCDSKLENSATDSKQSLMISSSKNVNSISWKYFYRGFTSVNAKEPIFNQFKKMEGGHIIVTDDAWHDFMGVYCPGIPYDISVDYSKQCLIAIISQGSKPTYSVSCDIKSINVSNGELDIQQNNFDTSTDICALNSDGSEHFFINIVVVSKSDIPLNSSSISSKIYS